jgi:hypothetical protein
MPIHPFGSETVTLTKSPDEGNKPRFSNGKAIVSIIAWDAKNTTVKRQYSPYSKIYNDEVTLQLQTYDELAMELQSDDSATWEGKSYSVQSVQPLNKPIGINKKIYVIALR